MLTEKSVKALKGRKERKKEQIRGVQSNVRTSTHMRINW